jgi:hypothetical protein
MHISYLRRQLGVRQGTPNADFLAETGERPLWLRWLQRAAPHWNSAFAAQPDSLLRQAVAATMLLAQAPGSRTVARQPWAQQLASTLAAVSLPLDFRNPCPMAAPLAANGSWHSQSQPSCSITPLAASGSHAARSNKLQHYTIGVWGGSLNETSLGMRARYWMRFASSVGVRPWRS